MVDIFLKKINHISFYVLKLLMYCEAQCHFYSIL